MSFATLSSCAINEQNKSNLSVQSHIPFTRTRFFWWVILGSPRANGKQAAKTTLPQTHCLQEENPKNTISGWSSCQINLSVWTLKHSYNWFILKTLGYVILQTQTTILNRFHHNQYGFFVRRAVERGIVIDRIVLNHWEEVPGNRNPKPRLNTFRTTCTDLPHSRKKHAAQMGTKTVHHFT